MLTFTARAREKVLFYLGQSGGELTALRITEGGGSGSGPAYDLTLVGDHDRNPSDIPVDTGEFEVLLERASAPSLQGATVDFVREGEGFGFQLRVSPAVGAASASEASPTPGPSSNGNSHRPMPLPPQGELADRVRELLDTQVNPAVAAHGGEIILADVKDTELFIIMGGGCQGCALSRMTLRQGVERMIRQAIPEVTEIHDVTDHDDGENPYY